MPEVNFINRSDRSSSAILDAAFSLFASQGYAATSMRQIADRGGLALGSIYNHFSSKEEIFKAIVLKRHPIYSVLTILREYKGTSLDGFIRNAAHNLVSELQQRPDFLNLLLIEMVEFKGQHISLVFEKIFPDILSISTQFTVYTDDLREIPMSVVLRAFIAMFFSYFITDMLLKQLMPPAMQDNALDLFVDIFLNGIKKPAASHSLISPEIL